MYGIFAYFWAILGVNVGKYSSTMEYLGMETHKYIDRYLEQRQVMKSFATSQRLARKVLAHVEFAFFFFQDISKGKAKGEPGLVSRKVSFNVGCLHLGSQNEDLSGVLVT